MGAVVLWGASNAGTKFVLDAWPPLFAGATRFLAAGLGLQLVVLLVRGSAGCGQEVSRRDLWLRTGLWLAIYIAVFQWAVRLIPVSRVGLYLGAAPVWAVLMEHGIKRDREVVSLYVAALLALAGVVVLFLPTLTQQQPNLLGEVLGVSCGWIWAWYGRQCRYFGTKLSGARLTASTMWRAGLLLMVPGLFELGGDPLPLNAQLLWVHAYCVVGGGVLAYWLWNSGLRRWSTSRVYLFNNLIPASTVLWAHYTLGEPITPTLALSMVLILVAVVVGSRARAAGQPDDTSSG